MSRRLLFLSSARGLGALGGLGLVSLLVIAVQALGTRDWSGLLEPRGSSREVPEAGVGGDALASAGGGNTFMSPFMAYARAMPNEPMPGQRTPPCLRGEKAINGGCWLGPIKDEHAPCGDTLYDYQGECYAAMGPVIRAPTSQDPR